MEYGRFIDLEEERQQQMRRGALFEAMLLDTPSGRASRTRHRRDVRVLELLAREDPTHTELHGAIPEDLDAARRWLRLRLLQHADTSRSGSWIRWRY